MERVSEETKQSIEKKLQMICQDLLLAWDERQTESELQKASIAAFGEPVVFDQDKLIEHYEFCERALRDIVRNIPGTHGER